MSISGHSREKLLCGNVVNMPYWYVRCESRNFRYRTQVQFIDVKVYNTSNYPIPNKYLTAEKFGIFANIIESG